MELVGPERAVHLFGIRLVGLNAVTGRKVLLSIVAIAALMLIGRGLRALSRRLLQGDRFVAARFWWRQVIRVATGVFTVLILLSIWLDDPARLTTAVGLITAGVAVALQRVIIAFAAYFIILRGRIFTVGDRIVMGGVRGDVISVRFLRTTIMEMGEPPPVQPDKPAVWVEARQYTGRLVTVTNDRIFDEPVYNYTRDFPFIWEEMRLPVPYTADRARAERILLEAVGRHTVQLQELGAEALAELQRRYFVDAAELEPRVYWQLTDNWLQMAVRFVTRERGVRALKDRITRDVLAAFDAAGIQVASTTFEVTGLPPLRIDTGDRPIGAATNIGGGSS
ncbi:MAG TPA: mechanosensitive ion channel family protein [Gemmatimonadales bacterium]|nr:mechanosensitive ion channel family protein [Gemmatimonadales bacterium]